MTGIVVSTAVAMLSYALLSPVTSRYQRWERRLIAYALFAHLLGVGALLSVYLYYYGYGDLVGFHKYGGFIADHLSADFINVAPRLIKLLLGIGGEELGRYNAGGSTGSMYAVAGILSYMFGKSLLSTSVIIACAAFYGKLAIYSVLRHQLAVEFHKPALIGSLLVPSAVFWSGSLLKESVVMSFLGALIWGGYTLASGSKRAVGAASLTLGAVGCALFKAYLLVPFAVAAMVWLYVRRARKTKTALAKPVYLIGAAGAIVALLVVIGDLYPRYDVFSADEQLFTEAKTMGGSEGGSNYSLLDTSRPTSSLTLFLTAPWAVFTALLRPAIVEARNPLSLANGLETLVLTLMLIRVIRRRSIKVTIAMIRNSPTLSFCAMFTLMLALGVGFATTNMGTLSRYRMPLLPYFVVLLGVLGAKSPQLLRGKNKIE